MATYEKNQKFIEAFGKNLRAIRKVKKISQEELAYRAELPLSQIGRVERGIINTSITKVYTLAKALKVHPKALFDFEFEED